MSSTELRHTKKGSLEADLKLECSLLHVICWSERKVMFLQQLNNGVFTINIFRIL